MMFDPTKWTYEDKRNWMRIVTLIGAFAILFPYSFIAPVLNWTLNGIPVARLVLAGIITLWTIGSWKRWW